MRFKHKKSKPEEKGKIFAILPHKCEKCRDTLWLEKIYRYRYRFQVFYSYWCLECYDKASPIEVQKMQMVTVDQ